MIVPLEELLQRDRPPALTRPIPVGVVHDNEFIQLPAVPIPNKERYKQVPKPLSEQRQNQQAVGKEPAVPHRQEQQTSYSKISQLNINFVPGAKMPPPNREPRTILPFPQKKYRRRPMLPQLINAPLYEMVQPNTSKNRCGTDQKPLRSQEPGASQTKMLDLMINILKTEDQPNQHPKTPTNKLQVRPTRFRTEPSVDREDVYFNELSVGKAQSSQKSRGPKVLENDLIKHSMNMNVVRKKLLSEHRNRFEQKSRQDIKSSQNHTRVASSKHTQKKQYDEMQMTFYPRPPPPKTVEDLYDNEFISVADINWIRKS